METPEGQVPVEMPVTKKGKTAAKNFKTSVATSLNDVFEGIPLAGDDILDQLIATTSDRTVEPQPIVQQVAAQAEATKTKVGAEHLGEEVGVDAAFVDQMKAAEKSGADMFEARERIFNTPTPPVGQGTIHTDEPAPNPEPTVFTDGDRGNNRIFAEEVVDWYDVLQSVASMYAYDYFSSPAEATKTVNKLHPKVMDNTATPQEKQLYNELHKSVMHFATRKSTFAQSVSMTVPLKQRIVNLMNAVFEQRGYKMQPELLLGMLMLTPLIVNGGRILLEKMGFEQADQLVGKFSEFVASQEQQYYKQ